MKIILFDFDGVIVDSFAICYKIMRGCEQITPDGYRARFEGNINDAIKLIPHDKQPFDFFGQYTPELMKCEPNQAVVRVIKELVRDHLCIIISSTISDSIKSYLTAYGLSDLFVEVLGNDVEKSKTKKIEAVLHRYNILPTETIFITDTLGDVNEAKKCSVESIAVTWGFHPAETLQKGNPLCIVDHPADILTFIKGGKTSLGRSQG
ncbi:HAD family hydrolase [Candidatus Gracilibacteria bacterium]|nr:HAD family hydrolase [Candidatus Gracilibacteria bacterium]